MSKSSFVPRTFFATNPMFNGNKLQFQFTYTGRIPIPGRYIPMLPSNFLFNSDGFLIGSNVHGEELEAKVKEALGEALETLTHPGEVGRLAEYEAKLKSGNNVMVTLSQLVLKKREATEKNDAKVIAEANLLFTRIFDWANTKYTRAMAEKERTPMASLMRLNAIVKCLPGTVIGEKAARALAELEADPRIVKEIRANKELRDIITQISDMKPTPNGYRDPNDPEFRKINFASLQVLKENCMRLITVCPETDAGAHSQMIFDDFKLKDVN